MNILEVVEEVRRRISERIQSLTGLRVTELNATISDIVFPEDGGRRRSLNGGSTSTSQLSEPRAMPSRELRPGASERETTEVRPRNRTRAEGEGGPLQEDETAELRPEDVSETRPPSEETTRRTERPEEG
jgi:hypothetical protein